MYDQNANLVSKGLTPINLKSIILGRQFIRGGASRVYLISSTACRKWDVGDLQVSCFYDSDWNDSFAMSSEVLWRLTTTLHALMRPSRLLVPSGDSENPHCTYLTLPSLTSDCVKAKQAVSALPLPTVLHVVTNTPLITNAVISSSCVAKNYSRQLAKTAWTTSTVQPHSSSAKRSSCVLSKEPVRIRVCVYSAVVLCLLVICCN